MMTRATLRRLAIAGSLGFLSVQFALALPRSIMAEDDPVLALTLRPHCADGTDPCPSFEIVDPETQRTEVLRNGDSLHMDLVLINPAKRPIRRVRAWIQYNAAVLNGEGISKGDAFPTAAPGELNFAASDGLIKIDLSAAAGQEPADEEIEVARLLMKVTSIPQTLTDVLNFYDVQAIGHTRVVAKKENGDDEDILTQIPSSVLVSFAEGEAMSSVTSASGTGSSSIAAGTGASAQNSSENASHPAAGSGALSSPAGSGAIASSAASSVENSGPVCGNGIPEENEGCDDGNFIAGDGCAVNCRVEVASSSGTASSWASSAPPLQPDGTSCGDHAACASGLCSGGICRGDVLKLEDGSACTANGQCLSGTCSANRCGPSPAATGSGAAGSGDTSAFALLQVRNLRITTEGTSVYVAWDPLASSQLKGYHLYYGTTSGRYIQRKAVSADSTSMAIRGLPEKTTYFVAIRAISHQDEESAFSQEVAVEVGNPKTSTAPLTGDLLKTKSPVTVPGETGMSSVVALLLTLSAIAGTTLASRRQMIVQPAPPPAR